MKLKLAILIVLFVGAHLLRGSIDDKRSQLGYTDTNTEFYTVIQPGEFASNMALSGFRAIAVDILWIKTTELQENQEWDELLSLLRLLGTLQPHNDQVWDFTYWNMAYNISIEQDNIEDSWQWVSKGVNVLETALKRNPNSPSLYLQSYKLFLFKIMNQERYLRVYYVKRFIETYGEHPSDRAITYMDKAIEIKTQLIKAYGEAPSSDVNNQERQRYDSLLKQLATAMHFKYLILKQRMEWEIEQAAPLEIGNAERNETLRRADAYHKLTLKQLEKREIIFQQTFGNPQQPQSGFRMWVSEIYEQALLMQSIEVAARPNTTAEQKTKLLQYATEQIQIMVDRLKILYPDANDRSNWAPVDQEHAKHIEIWIQQVNSLKSKH